VQSYYIRYFGSSTSKPNITIKNNIWVKNEICTAGSKILYNFKPIADAFIVSLVRAHYHIAGLTSLQSFASGTSGINTQMNLSSIGYLPGGSSSGAALSIVFDKDIVLAIGSDSGGSVATPAIINRIYSFKPSNNRLSRVGLIPLSNALDCIGFLSSSLQELKTAFTICDVYDSNDSLCNPDIVRQQVSNYATPSFITVGFMINGESRGDLFLNFKESINESYSALTDPYFYSNLNKFDYYKFNNNRSDGLRDLKEVKKNRELNLSSSVKKRIEAANDFFENSSAKVNTSAVYTLFRDLFKNFNFIIIHCPRPDWSLQKLPTDEEIADIDFRVSCANILGLPRITYKNYIIMAPYNRDYELLNFVIKDLPRYI